MALRHADRHEDHLVGVHAQALADRLQHADDAQAPVAEADQFAHGRRGAEDFLLDLGADHGHRRAAVPVGLGQEAPCAILKLRMSR
jgi:hypothetical protein